MSYRKFCGFVRGRCLLCCAALMVGPVALRAEEPAPEAPPGAYVELRDGSLIKGTIVGMDGGQLTIDTGFAGPVSVDFSQIKNMSSELKLSLQLSEDTVLNGPITSAGDDTITVGIPDTDEDIRLSLSKIRSINKKPITYTGNINIGGQVADGNTRTKSGAANAEFIARSERQRLTLRGAWNYAQDSRNLTARNTRGGIKYDFFFTKKWYLWSSAFFEGDKFQDIDLRTALTAGLGYQIIEKGESTVEWLSRASSNVELGLGYFNENFARSPDDDYIAARWAFRFDWDVVPDRLIFFHFHEGYPSLADIKDLYITTEQGIRLLIWSGFAATFQINWRWDNTPAITPTERFGRSDTMYLATLGYNFAF